LESALGRRENSKRGAREGRAVILKREERGVLRANERGRITSFQRFREERTWPLGERGRKTGVFPWSRAREKKMISGSEKGKTRRLTTLTA